MKPAILLTLTALAAFGQLRDNRDKTMTCDQQWRNNNRGHHCSISEQTVPSLSRWSIDAGNNGGITVRGWTGKETLVRSRIEAWADTDSAASLLAGQVHSDSAAGMIRPSGPETKNNGGWSVSYEVFVPHSTDLTLSAHNGGITISDIKGRLDMSTTNGGVKVTRVAGEIKGKSTNGGVHVELNGDSWTGSSITLRTTNGGVHLALPANASAHVQTETINGGVRSDFPVPSPPGERRPRKLDFNIGAGGPLIQLSTTNGGVHLERI